MRMLLAPGVRLMLRCNKPLLVLKLNPFTDIPLCKTWIWLALRCPLRVALSAYAACWTFVTFAFMIWTVGNWQATCSIWTDWILVPHAFVAVIVNLLRPGNRFTNASTLLVCALKLKGNDSFNWLVSCISWALFTLAISKRNRILVTDTLVCGCPTTLMTGCGQFCVKLLMFVTGELSPRAGAGLDSLPLKWIWKKPEV